MMRRSISAVHSLRRGQRGGFWLRPHTTDAKLIAEHVAYLHSSADRWHARQGVAEHVEYLQRSECIAMDAKLIAKHVAYLQDGPQRRESVLVAEHVSYLRSSADRAAAAGLAQMTAERWHAMYKQVAIRLDGLEAAISARLERTTDAKLIAEHAAYLQSSADRWHARQGVAEHVEYLERSKRIAMDTKLIAEHVAYLKSSADRWHARQGVAEHVEYLQRSAAANAKLIAKHVAYLQDRPQRRESVLVAEHVSYLRSPADRAAAAGLAQMTEERWHAMYKQVAIRLDGLEAAIAVRLELTKEISGLF